MSDAPELRVINHDHRYEASPCDEGCECNYLHLSCKDEDCDFMAMADGWLGVNVDWIWHIEEDTPEELQQLKDRYDWRKVAKS